MTPALGYTEMKDSGLVWVGNIPSHWELIANKYVMHKEKHICDHWCGQDVMSLTMNGVIVRDLDNPTGKMPTTFDGYQFVQDGDLLMCLFDIDVTPRCVGRVFHDGVTSPAYSCFKLHPNVDLGYFYYYYLMMDHTKELLHLAKNLRHSFTEEQIGQLKVPFPPLNEQQAISAFLDSKCAKIDEIIAEAKASIEDYKQWKASIIYEAVTKGLDPDVEMKDSGIATFGMVPAHWGVHRFQNLCTLRNEENTGGRGLLSVYLDKGVIHYSDSTRMQVHKPSDSLDKYQNVYIGDFVLNNQQAWRGSVGVSQYDGIISPAYFVYKLSAQCVPSYMNYLVRDICMVQQYELASRGVGTIQRNIYEPWLKKARFVLPPVNEQTVIATYLDVQCAKIDELITEKQTLISDLESYKKSLIYEVVTGKRQVC